MTFDLGLASITLLFGVLGMRSGAIRQLSHWIGLACAYLFSGPLASALTPAAATQLHLPAIGVKVALSLLLFTTLALLASWLVHAVLVKATGGAEDGRWDRVGGFVLGAGKGAVLAIALLAVALYFEKPLNRFLGPTPAAFHDSAVVGFLSRHDLLSAVSIPVASNLEKLAKAAQDPDAARALANDPNMKAILDNPEIRSVLKDPALTRALSSGDFSALINDPRFAALLKDPRLTKAVNP